MFRFNHKFGVFLFCLFTFVSSLTQAVSVGVSPPFLDMGELEPGQSKIARFYVITPSEDLFIVDLAASKIEDMYTVFDEDRYKDLLPFYSEQDPSPWIKFIDNPVELFPPEEEIKAKFGTIERMREIKFIIKIPEDAEPGYHIGKIHMNPKIIQEDNSISLISIVPLKYIVKVKGEAVRKGEIINIDTNGVVNSNLWLRIFYQNTGTVTTTLDGGHVTILDKYGRAMIGSRTNLGFVKPGEIEELDAFIKYDLLDKGTYEVTA
jgi:hypothetical protein